MSRATYSSTSQMMLIIVLCPSVTFLLEYTAGNCTDSPGHTSLQVSTTRHCHVTAQRSRYRLYRAASHIADNKTQNKTHLANMSPISSPPRSSLTAHSATGCLYVSTNDTAPSPMTNSRHKPRRTQRDFPLGSSQRWETQYVGRHIQLRLSLIVIRFTANSFFLPAVSCSCATSLPPISDDNPPPTNCPRQQLATALQPPPDTMAGVIEGVM